MRQLKATKIIRCGECPLDRENCEECEYCMETDIDGEWVACNEDEFNG